LRVLLLLLATCVPVVAAAPHITPGQSATVAVKRSTTLAGTGFGTRKGKVLVAGKKAKVTAWTDTAITFVVPPSVPDGPAVVDVVDKEGADFTPDYLTVTGSSAVLAKHSASGSVGGKRFRPSIYYVFTTGSDWQLQMKTPGKHGKVLTFHVYGLGTLPAVFHGTEGTPATLTYNDRKGTTFTGQPGAFTIVITHQENNRLAGAIYGVLTAPDDRTVLIRSVQFSYATGL
jgi:uncharacterized protein (TIGR03437 family)